MERKNKLIIAIAVVSAIGILAVAWGTFLHGPDLSSGDRNILVLAGDKTEQPGGAVDMAFMVTLENGSIKNYTAIYPGGKTHPTQPAPGNLQGKMLLHDCLWNGQEQGMQYAKEIVESNTGMHADAVVVVYNEGLDSIINSVGPLKIDGVETNLSATDIIRENDNYSGYKGRTSAITGTMSRGDAVMVLVKALSQAAEDPDKKNTMVKTALSEYSKGNILMTPKGSFIGLMSTKGFEKLL
ncbi:hypothetical protein SDC9_30546 [bioreactor metagenome]|uniref:Cell envelope-related transcriptional attenuator domain-containing protein n=1 Tax=bioreactor metagenome TaxID=1076179 RepID=A0A644V073_9ZZZZ|nr:DUF4012 domain-containing protein [Methanobrevibacter sp.]MEA4957522.1 DUF4012 domain-containing protein [Methanobrevibacter sp.]